MNRFLKTVLILRMNFDLNRNHWEIRPCKGKQHFFVSNLKWWSKVKKNIFFSLSLIFLHIMARKCQFATTTAAYVKDCN